MHGSLFLSDLLSMSTKQQLHLIFSGKLSQAVQDYLHGDWSRLPQLATMPAAIFDAWADSIELPYGRVSKTRQPVDGVYVLFDQEGWLVFEQQNRMQLPGARTYPTYKQAKRAALRIEFLHLLRGKS